MTGVPRAGTRWDRAEIGPRASNEKELSSYKAMYASGHGPLGAVPESGGSGTGGNVIKQSSPEMAHVPGAKSSDYLSATTSRVGAVNPKGEQFGEGAGKKPA